MLNSDDDNNNGNKVGMVKRRSMQRPTLFPESSTIKYEIASESPIDGLGSTFTGLVEYGNDRMHPPFLGRSDVSCFSINLRDQQCEGGRDIVKEALTLNGPPTAADSAVAGRRTQTKVAGGMMMPTPPCRAHLLVQDLNGKYGD